MESKRSEVRGQRSEVGRLRLREGGGEGAAFEGEIDFVRERVSVEGEVWDSEKPSWWTKDDTRHAVMSLNRDAYTPGCDGVCDWCADRKQDNCNAMEVCRVCDHWESGDGFYGECQDPAYYGTRKNMTQFGFQCDVFSSRATPYELVNRMWPRKPVYPEIKEAFNAEDLAEFIEVVKRLLQLGVITLEGARKARKEEGV